MVASGEEFTRFDGRLHFFKYENSPFWYAGFHFKGKYIRKTTKEREKTHAISVGERWYTLKQAEILTLGSPSDGYGPTVRQVAKSTVKELAARAKKGDRSAAYQKGVELLLNKYILPYFGSTPVKKIDVVSWNKFIQDQLEKEKTLSRGSFHQIKNALRSVLNTAYRQGVISSVPQLKDTVSGPKIATPRIWFEPDEYRRVLRAIKAHRKTLIGTRWVADCDELYDYFHFNCNAGLRVGEIKNVRFCDVSIETEDVHGEERQYLLIRNIKGKRGTGECRTMDGAVDAFERIIKRRKIKDVKSSEEPLFEAYHRDMFREILVREELRYTKERPPRRRDLTVCRHTYITFRLMYGASAFEVANNCRTSATMIQEHYARWLSPRLTKGLNVRKFRSV
ncbi:MAG: hypothetical protein VW338_04105 [Rhodospirillaceae bacterium]|jgi:integrase